MMLSDGKEQQDRKKRQEKTKKGLDRINRMVRILPDGKEQQDRKKDNKGFRHGYQGVA